MNLKFTILGCGNSTGVPAVGNHWGACDPAEPKNRRSRASLVAQSENTTLVIDTGPDFRFQMNRENIENLDAVLYTHAHSDHVAGMDDLRSFAFRAKKRVPIYANREALDDMIPRFDYLFNGGKHEIYKPALEINEILAQDYGREMRIGDISFIPFEQDHGSCMSVGFRFGDFAYSTDILSLDDMAIKTLQGIETWIVDAAAYKETGNKVHANFETIFALNKRIGAKQVWLTSLSLAMDYKTLCNELPEGYAPAWDGLEIRI